MAIKTYTRGGNRKWLNDVRVIELIDLKTTAIMVIFSSFLSAMFSHDSYSFTVAMTVMFFINILALFGLKSVFLFYRDGCNR